MERPGPDNRIKAIAQANFRNDRRRFGIKRADRRALLRQAPLLMGSLLASIAIRV